MSVHLHPKFCQENCLIHYPCNTCEMAFNKFKEERKVPAITCYIHTVSIRHISRKKWDYCTNMNVNVKILYWGASAATLIHVTFETLTFVKTPFILPKISKRKSFRISFLRGSWNVSQNRSGLCVLIHYVGTHTHLHVRVLFFWDNTKKLKQSIVYVGHLELCHIGLLG